MFVSCPQLPTVHSYSLEQLLLSVHKHVLISFCPFQLNLFVSCSSFSSFSNPALGCVASSLHRFPGDLRVCCDSLLARNTFANLIGEPAAMRLRGVAVVTGAGKSSTAHQAQTSCCRRSRQFRKRRRSEPCPDPRPVWRTIRLLRGQERQPGHRDRSEHSLPEF